METTSAHPLLLEVDDLVVSFGNPGRLVTVVRGLSLTIRRGESVAVVGESGSGKTVTSLAILGLVGKRKKTEVVTGRIAFTTSDGNRRDLVALDRKSFRRIQGDEIAMIFQEPMTALNPVLRVGEQIAEVLIEHRGVSRAEAWATAESLLTRVGIPDPGRRLHSFPHQLSGGMRQRVMIAIALSCRPALLIADEPTTALDVTIQAQILDLIAELKNDFGSSVLFISHDLGVVRQIADRIVVMYAGYVVEEGPTAAIIADPRHPYTRGLIGCVPRITPEWENRAELHPIPGAVADPARPPKGCAFHPRCRYRADGVCDSDVPPLEPVGPDRKVRCRRWREIEASLH